MAHFIDTSDSNLVKKIKQVQHEREPTVAEFLNPIKPNLYRTPQVQKDQVPTSQLEDEFTPLGLERKLEIEHETAAEKKAREDKAKQDAYANSFFTKLFSAAIPTPGQLKLLAGLAKQDPSQIAEGLAQIKVEGDKRLYRESHTRELKATKKALQALKNKRKKKTVTNQKGQTVI